jgi:hypothetical protein
MAVSQITGSRLCLVCARHFWSQRIYNGNSRVLRQQLAQCKRTHERISIPAIPIMLTALILISGVLPQRIMFLPQQNSNDWSYAARIADILLSDSTRIPSRANWHHAPDPNRHVTRRHRRPGENGSAEVPYYFLSRGRIDSLRLC